MVALTVGSLAVATFYTVARHTTRFFQEQSRVSNLQDHLRYAMAQVKRDIKRAGYLAPPPPVVASPTLCSTPNANLVPTGGLNRAGAIALHARNTPDNVTSGIDPGNVFAGNANVRVDRLVLLGNYETSASYPATFTASQPGTVTLTAAAGDYTALRDFGDWANGAPAQLDEPSLQAAFAIGRPIVIEGAGGMRHLALTMGINSGNFGTGGGIALTFAPNATGPAGACPLQNGWVAPLQSVEYTVQSAASAGTTAAATNAGLLLDPNETLPQLHRREFDLLTDAPRAGGEDRAILDYVVAFHVDFIVDGATVAKNDDDSIDWVAEAGTAQATAAANPETIRGARILLAARASGHDRELSAVGVGPLQVFRLNNARRGGARVRTLRADVFIPNLAVQ